MGLRALRSRRLHRAAWLEVFATLSARDRGRYGGVVPLEALRQFRREILDLAARHGARNVRVFGSVGDVCGRRRRPHRRPRRASGIRIDGVRTERPLTACHCRPASSRPRGERGAWGGEFFVGSLREGFTRVAHLTPAVLDGGDAAAKHPVQAAAGFVVQVEFVPDLT